MPTAKQLTEELDALGKTIDRLERRREIIRGILLGRSEYIAITLCDDWDRFDFIRVGSKVSTKYGDDLVIKTITKEPTGKYNYHLLTFENSDKEYDCSRISHVYDDDYVIPEPPLEFDI